MFKEHLFLVSADTRTNFGFVVPSTNPSDLAFYGKKYSTPLFFIITLFSFFLYSGADISTLL